jgi:general secretion pathway protein A
MYKVFFGLAREPFSVAPDPKFLYLSPKHREAIAHLVYGLLRGAGFVLLTGEIGAGKTTVWRTFLNRLPSTTDVAYVVNPKLDVTALLTRICEDLGIELPTGTVDLIDAIHGHLLLASARGRRTLIVVDEAQSLAPEVLEQLRLLTNLDASGGKLQVLLIGQPELRSMLFGPRLEPLAQRVVARFHLPSLPADETARYIEHRLFVAGLNGPSPFDAQAIELIHGYCGGVPRRINVLCDRALFLAKNAGSRRVDRNIVVKAAEDVFGRVPDVAGAVPNQDAPADVPRPVWIAAAAAIGALLVTGAIIGFLLASKPTGTVGSASSNPAPPARMELPGTESSAAPTTPLEQPAHLTIPGAPPVLVVANTPPAPPAAPSDAPPAPQEAASPAKGSPPPEVSKLKSVIDAASNDEAAAWRSLASLWGATLGAGDPCAVAAGQGLRCYRSRGGLGSIRQLGRPGILTLADSRGRAAYAVLVGLGDEAVTFRSGIAEQSVPLADLARAWRGDFATFWRPPTGYRDGELAKTTTELAPWLDQRLAAVDGSTVSSGAQPLTARVLAFQVSQGLVPDGVAGPLTLMQLNRASGIDEPKLQVQR